MFGMSMPEVLLILAVALIVFGPKKLPELAKSLGRALHEFKKATSEFKETMEENTGIKEVKKAITDVNIKDVIDISSETSDCEKEFSHSFKQPLASKSSEASDTLKAKIPDNTENLEKKTELKQKTEKGTEKDDK